MLRWLSLALLCAPAAAQDLPGFSPGVFQNTAAMAVSGDPCVVGSGTSQSAAFFARLATQPTTTRAKQYCTLINALVSGGVWSKIDALYIFAAYDSPTALTNLVSSSYGATAIGTPTFTQDKGFVGGTGKYINTAFNPNTATTPNYVLNSSSVGIWNLSTSSDANGWMGNYNGTNITYLANYQTGGSFFTSPVNAAGATGGVIGLTYAQGMYVASRASSTIVNQYQNGSLFNSQSQVSVALINNNIWVLAVDNSGSPLLNSSDKIAMAVIGGDLSSVQAAFYAAVHTYMQIVGGAP